MDVAERHHGDVVMDVINNMQPVQCVANETITLIN